MSKSELVRVDNSRTLLTGIELPDPPPTRVYISGREFRLQSPRVALPKLINTVKVIWNWVNTSAYIAKNVFYLKTSPTFVTSDVTALLALANALQDTVRASTPLPAVISDKWTLTNTTVKDNAGTTAQATSTTAAGVGTNAGTCQPPQVAVCVSWQIAESYRGGKPRWYLPGVPSTAINGVGASGLTSAHATSVEGAATAFMNLTNALNLAGGNTVTLGTISYYTGHALRPTPQFRTFINAKVHQRLDSQRRRSGRESSYGTIN